MLLQLEVQNPNAFSLGLEDLDYELEIEGATWLKGGSERAVSLSAGESKAWPLHVKLNLAHLGASAYRLLTSRARLSYRFHGRATATTSLPMLESLTWPFDLRADAPLVK